MRAYRKAQSFRLFMLMLMAALIPGTSVSGDDWPMWRYDAMRRAASAEALPEGQMQLLWRRDLGAHDQAWDDPLNLDLMTFDRVLEPIVTQGRLCVGLNTQDQLACFDLSNGERLWTHFADAPVRLPPAAADGRVYFVSDDGFLYCVNVEDGTRLWRFQGAPNSLHAIGNRRLTSAWPARGGPVIREGTVYFAASIWPFMGTFLYALDVRDGDQPKVRWVNDSTGAHFTKQPHSAPSFAGVAPQGALVATEQDLIVPGGRSVPAVFNRASGQQRYFEINAGGKGTGGSFVAATDSHFFVHTRMKGTRAFHLKDGVKTAFMPNEPVIAGEVIYAADVSGKDKQPVVRATMGVGSPKTLWELPVDGRGDLIATGSHLIAGGEKFITAIRLPAIESGGANKSDLSPEIHWQLPVDQPVERLLFADGKLIAVSANNRISVYGVSDKPSNPRTFVQAAPSPLIIPDSDRILAKSLLRLGETQGYAFCYGPSDHATVRALAAESPFSQLAIVDSHQQRVESFRRELNAAHQYGKVTVHVAETEKFMAPKHTAHHVFIVEPEFLVGSPETIRTVYESVRPYGGVLSLATSDKRLQRQLAETAQQLQLEQASIKTTMHAVAIQRVGPLLGSADWTHQHGDIANTIKSDDQRVKLPLGILWFGGSSNMDVLPRHGHGPPEQVVGGRLFIQGINSLSARDVYTGRVLWKRTFDDLGVYDVYYDATYKNTPLNTAYNQVHIPGANARGTNYVATEDRVYLLEGDHCLVLDPRTGKTLKTIVLPPDEQGKRKRWGYIGIYKNVLIGGVGFANYRQRHELAFPEDEKLKSTRAGFGAKSLDRAASLALVGFDRFSGEQLWKVDAVHSFWHNGVVAGDDMIFCLDRNPNKIEEAMRRRGVPQPSSYRVLALDYQTGEPQWESKDVFGTWLGYSSRHGLLLQAGAAASDRLKEEVGAGMAVYEGGSGKVRWRNDRLKYAGPCILHNEWIITNANSYAESAGAFHLLDGKQKMVPNPLTGESQPWKIKRAYGCNNIIASEHMLTFRSGAAGFYDLSGDGGTGNLGGFKSGCTANLVAANGVLNAPDYTRTCSCAYQNQTSLALVHMPEMDIWTIHTLAAETKSLRDVQQLAINFGAPGDRRDDDGTLWLEHPAVGGESPDMKVEAVDATYFRRHSLTMSGSELPWVKASGARGMKLCRIGLGLPAPQRFDLKLLFAAPPDIGLDGCKFQVTVQTAKGATVLPTIQLTEGRATERTLKGIEIGDELWLKFTSQQGDPVISGLHLKRVAE